MSQFETVKLTPSIEAGWNSNVVQYFSGFAQLPWVLSSSPVLQIGLRCLLARRRSSADAKGPIFGLVAERSHGVRRISQIEARRSMGKLIPICKQGSLLSTTTIPVLKSRVSLMVEFTKAGRVKIGKINCKM